MASRTTFCRVKIATPDLSWAGRPSQTLEWTGKKGDALDTLTACSVQTSLSLGGNGFTLQFAPRQFERDSVADQIPTNSLVTIEMGSSDHDEDPTVIVGLTSEPVETEVFAGGPSQRAITIPGRGLDSVLAEAGIYRNAALAVLEPAGLEALAEDLANVVGPALDAGISEGKIASFMGFMWVAGIDPREAIARVIFYYLANEPTTLVNLRLPGTRTLADLLTAGGRTPNHPAVARWARDFGIAVEKAKKSGKDQVKKMQDAARLRCPIPPTWTLLRPDLVIPTVSTNPAAGSILDIIQGAADQIFHELYAVHRDGRCDVMFGVKPFIDPDEVETLVDGMTQFNVHHIQSGELETVEITTGDLTGQQSLRRGLPVSNLWHVLPGNGMVINSQALKNMVPPAVSGAGNYSDFMRFGLRPKEIPMPYLPANYIGNTAGVSKDAQMKATELEDLTAKLNRTLKAWEDPHPFMWHGGLTAQGRAAFKPGRRLLWRGQDVNGRPDGRPLREFYVDGAGHTYQFANGAYTSSLRVTRGWELGAG